MNNLEQLREWVKANTDDWAWLTGTVNSKRLLDFIASLEAEPVEGELYKQAIIETRANIKKVFKPEYCPAIYEAFDILNNSILRAEAQAEDLNTRPTEQTEQGWISVEDRLPDDVSVQGKVAVLINGMYFGIGEYADNYNAWFHNVQLYKTCSEVTHWMPLPQPPTKEVSE